jgi:mitochondrial import inner membrane translocase subunit TIM17
MGCIGGGIWHTIKGTWMAPSNAKIHGSIAAVTARSPMLGGQFAV